MKNLAVSKSEKMEEEFETKRKKNESESINLNLIKNLEKIEISVTEMKSTIKEIREHYINGFVAVKK